MRFDALHFNAFGPFTGLRMNFPAGGADLHLIHGANEAGKSSMLRAIGDLLFEIPARSADNFLHAHKDMRLSADLRSRDGRLLSIQRRKGNRNTLLDAEGAVLPDESLGAWLGHVDRDYFATMFGLGSEQLRSGAAALLRGEGDLGKALFSASLGGTPVHKVMEALAEDARQSFAGRARSRIRTAAAAYADEMKLVREHLMKPEDWDAAEREITEARERQTAVEQQRAALQTRCDWLQRCLDALPTLSKWQARERELAELPPVPAVAASFIAEARPVLQLKRQTEIELRQCENEVRRLDGLLKACLPREDLLAREVELGSLHQGLGVYRDQRQRLAARRSELAALEHVLRNGMRDLSVEGGIEDVDRLRLTANEFAAIKEHAARLMAAVAKHEANDQALRDKEAVIRGLDSRVSPLAGRDVSRLREALAQAAAAGEAQRTLDVAEADLAKAVRDLQSQQRLLAGAPADPSAVHALSLPAKARTAALQAEHEELQQALKQAVKEQADAAVLDARLRRELTQMEQGGTLPGLRDLASAREQRQAVWQKLVQAGSAGDAAVFKPLAGRHEELQAGADAVADSLREHADQVAKAEERRAVIAGHAAFMASVAGRIDTLKQSLADWQSRWAAVWQPAGLEPGSPAEMLEWREAWLEFGRRFDRWRSAGEELIRRQAVIAAAAKLLRLALQDTEGRAFAVLLDEARRAVAKADKDEGARSTLQQQLDEALQQRDQLAAETARLATAVQDLTSAWTTTCNQLNLGGLGPVAAMEMLEQRRALVSRFDGWKASRSEAAQLDEQTQTFEHKAGALAVALGHEKGDAEVLVTALWRELEEAREARKTQVRLAAELEAARAKQREAIHSGETVATRLQAMLAQVAITDEAALEPLLGTLEARARMVSERDHLRETLQGLARGETFDDFVAKVQVGSPEELSAEKARLEIEMASLHAQRDEAIKATVQAGQRQAALKQAGDAAAVHRQNAENQAAGLRADAARYVRLRLATHFLEQQIDRFRQENQAPLMKRASALFQAITLGSFEGLATDFMDDVPVIVGQRQHQPVTVAGMSEGTRDQLYLSLRLAAIERHVDAHEPLPLVLDDLLMTFDDARAAAILPVLRDLSRKTQVLLFTHHEHLVDLCQNTLGTGEFTVHQLPANGVPVRQV